VSVEPPRQSNVRLRDSAPEPLEEQAFEELPTGPTLRVVANDELASDHEYGYDDPSTGPTMRQQLPTDPTAKRGERGAAHKTFEVPQKGEGCFRGWSAQRAFVEAERALRFLDHERAEAAATHAVLMDPDKPDYRTLLAFIEAERKGQVPWWSSDAERHYDEELETLSRVIGEHPNHEPAYYYRARLLMRLKRFQAAMSDFEMASILNPGNIDAARELRCYDNAKRKRRREQAAKKRSSGVMRWLKGDE
jgi:tetratricopeptide (TPR) repeat protein